MTHITLHICTIFNFMCAIVCLSGNDWGIKHLLFAMIMYGILYIIFIYTPGGFAQDFTDFLSSIIKMEKVLMIGDFNLHVDDPSCNICSDFFFRVLQTLNFTS